MDETEVLVAITALRTNPAYQAAETLRQKTLGGAGAMASKREDSAEYKAVRLLISTWETIAVVASGAKSYDKIFEVTPLCFMYNQLEDATKIISRKIPGFGENFGKLNKKYHDWLKKKKKSAHYVTGACDLGMHCMFG